MNRIFRNTIFYLLIFLVVIGIVSYFNGSTQKTTSVSYDKFITKLEKGEVRNVQLQPKNGVFEVKDNLTTLAKENNLLLTHQILRNYKRKLMTKRKVLKLSINQQKKQVLG